MSLRARLLATFIPVLGLATAALAAETYTADTVHSTVIFRVKHMNVSYAYGRFDKLTGTFTLDAADPSKSKFDFTVDVDSVDTADKKRDGHLKNADFFNAKQFPKITFKSTSVASAGKDTLDVTGDLTLHGTTKPVSMKVDLTGTGPGFAGGKLAGFETTFTIKRSDFGMGGMVGPLGDEVRITVSVEGSGK